MNYDNTIGVARLNFANTSYQNWSSGNNGGTTGFVSAVLMGNFDGGHPVSTDLVQALANVAGHELGHGMGFKAPTTGWVFTDEIRSAFPRSLVWEGQYFGVMKPNYYDMTVPQNRQAVKGIKKQPEYNPQ